MFEVLLKNKGATSHDAETLAEILKNSFRPYRAKILDYLFYK